MKESNTEGTGFGGHAQIGWAGGLPGWVSCLGRLGGLAGSQKAANAAGTLQESESTRESRIGNNWTAFGAREQIGWVSWLAALVWSGLVWAGLDHKERAEPAMKYTPVVYFENSKKARNTLC